jgi:hypothetical protein
MDASVSSDIIYDTVHVHRSLVFWISRVFRENNSRHAGQKPKDTLTTLIFFTRASVFKLNYVDE